VNVYQQEDSSHLWVVFVGFGLILLVLLVGGGMWGCPQYYVYERRLAGQAELSQAEANRRIKTLEAEASLESSRHLAAAEVERAKGVAEANRIIGASLHDNEEYLRYLWIHNLETAQATGTQVIYVPTEANLPILEAARKTLNAQPE
jgi:regulator of protease activity HflC (stomatin/prohibitin superfamily)